MSQIETVISIAGRHFPQVPHPSRWSGDQNPWDGAEFVHALVNALATRRSDDARAALRRLSEASSLSTHREFVKHALANQQALAREEQYRQPNWKQTVSALRNGPPANFADLQALVLDHFRDINNEITNRNTDIYKQFWNEGAYGKITTPRSEETSRDVLVEMLRTRMRPMGIIIEPEGHMAADKRVDISITFDNRKTMMELKRDYHRDVWHAHETQLDRLYTADPDASGYGVYGVFWFGPRRPKQLPRRPDRGPAPRSANEMQDVLASMIPPDKREKLGVVVVDVSGPPAVHGAGQRAKPSVQKRQSKSKKQTKSRSPSKAPSASKARTMRRGKRRKAKGSKRK